MSATLAIAAFGPPCAVRAQPPERAFAPPLRGHVVRAGQDADAVVAAAEIAIFWQNERGEDQRSVAQLRTDDSGDFNATALPQQLPGGFYLIVARAPELAPAVLRVPALQQISPLRARYTKPLTVKLQAAAPVPVQVVDSAGAPVAGALVRVDKLRITNNGMPNSSSPNLNSDWGQALAWNITDAVQTDARGRASLLDLPREGAVQLSAHKAGFSDNMVRTLLSSDAPISIVLPRETTVEGRALLGSGPDARPLGITKWRLKLQGWQAPWSEYANWRMSYFAKDGHFKIDNLPSLEALGEPTYGANIDLDGVENPAPGVTGVYAPPQRGYNVLMTIEHDGKTERWISYVQGLQNGWKFKEGEQLQRDINFEPMALLRGTMTDEKRPQISYHDPKSIYSDWVVTPDAKGKFELSLPIGDVQLRIGNQTLDVKDLQPHEEREVVVP